jgi:hypothetical protein
MTIVAGNIPNELLHGLCDGSLSAEEQREFYDRLRRWGASDDSPDTECSRSLEESKPEPAPATFSQVESGPPATNAPSRSIFGGDLDAEDVEGFHGSIMSQAEAPPPQTAVEPVFADDEFDAMIDAINAQDNAFLESLKSPRRKRDSQEL